MSSRGLRYEFGLARLEIRQGRFERSMALLTAFAAIVSGWEAYAQHMRGAFSDWLMWTPVGLTPPTIVAALGALFSERIARHVLPVVAVMSLVDGLLGFVLHLRGIGRMPGGWKLGRYNVVMGPPIFAPLLTCTVGIVGLLAGLLRREQSAPANVGSTRCRLDSPRASTGPVRGARSPRTWRMGAFSARWRSSPRFSPSWPVVRRTSSTCGAVSTVA